MVDLKAKEKWDSKLFRIVNSTACFSLAYILITWGGYFAMATMAKIFKFDSNVYYYGIRFLLNGHKWDRMKVSFIFSTFPVFALIVGLLMLYIYVKGRNLKSNVNVFLLWGFVIGTSMFTSQAFLASMGANEFNSPFYQHLGVVFAWWFLPVALVYAFNLPFTILFLYFAINSPRHFIRFAYSYAKVNKMERRRKYFVEVAIVPFILGAVITTMVTFPMNMFVHFVYLFSIGLSLVIGWVALFYIEVMKDDVLAYKSLQKFGFIFLIALVFLIFFVKASWRGIFFGL